MDLFYWFFNQNIAWNIVFVQSFFCTNCWQVFQFFGFHFYFQFVSSDYPAIFAIFAGVSIILSLAVLFVAVGLWNMDPGKDSIIYRMTTTRMKKDWAACISFLLCSAAYLKVYWKVNLVNLMTTDDTDFLILKQCVLTSETVCFNFHDFGKCRQFWAVGLLSFQYFVHLHVTFIYYSFCVSRKILVFGNCIPLVFVF